MTIYIDCEYCNNINFYLNFKKKHDLFVYDSSRLNDNYYFVYNSIILNHINCLEKYIKNIKFDFKIFDIIGEYGNFNFVQLLQKYNLYKISDNKILIFKSLFYNNNLWIYLLQNFKFVNDDIEYIIIECLKIYDIFLIKKIFDFLCNFNYPKFVLKLNIDFIIKDIIFFCKQYNKSNKYNDINYKDINNFQYINLKNEKFYDFLVNLKKYFDEKNILFDIVIDKKFINNIIILDFIFDIFGINQIKNNISNNISNCSIFLIFNYIFNIDILNNLDEKKIICVIDKIKQNINFFNNEKYFKNIYDIILKIIYLYNDNFNIMYCIILFIIDITIINNVNNKNNSNVVKLPNNDNNDYLNIQKIFNFDKQNNNKVINDILQVNVNDDVFTSDIFIKNLYIIINNINIVNVELFNKITIKILKLKKIEIFKKIINIIGLKKYHLYFILHFSLHELCNFEFLNYYNILFNEKNTNFCEEKNITLDYVDVVLQENKIITNEVIIYLILKNKINFFYKYINIEYELYYFISSLTQNYDIINKNFIDDIKNLNNNQTNNIINFHNIINNKKNIMQYSNIIKTYDIDIKYFISSILD